MNKLPVGKTISDAYGFTFSHLGTIIGLIWFPMVVSTLLNFLPELAGNLGDGNPSLGSAGAVENLAVLLLTLLLSAIMYVAVVRQALGLRQGPAVFHFALGQAEFRVYGALLVVYFLAIFFALAQVEAQSLGAAASTTAALVAVPGIFFVLYLAIRFGFLLVPAIVAENRIDFAHVWALTRGNFWRLLAVVAAIAVPLWLIESASALALMGGELQHAWPTTAQTSDPQVIQQHLEAIEDVFRRHMPALMFIGLILAPFSIGLTLAASASAYRALSGGVPGSRAVTA
jgi:hypothetical protein